MKVIKNSGKVVTKNKTNYKIKSGIINKNTEMFLYRNKELIKRLAKV